MGEPVARSKPNLLCQYIEKQAGGIQNSENPAATRTVLVRRIDAAAKQQGIYRNVIPDHVFRCTRCIAVTTRFFGTLVQQQNRNRKKISKTHRTGLHAQRQQRKKDRPNPATRFQDIFDRSHANATTSYEPGKSPFDPRVVPYAETHQSWSQYWLYVMLQYSNL